MITAAGGEQDLLSLRIGRNTTCPDRGIGLRDELALFIVPLSLIFLDHSRRSCLKWLLVISLLILLMTSSLVVSSFSVE